jgi:protein-disulfide isomerase-like protein with CxxC motif
MGGLVKDMRDFRDESNDIGGEGNMERSNQNIAKHWLEASSVHGMPVEPKGFQLFSNEHPSTWPMDIAYKAAQFENQQLADKFLRKMREAVSVEVMAANQTEILIELAHEVGLNVGEFIKHMTDGSAEKAFHEDLKLTTQYKAHGFPSFLVQYLDKAIMLRGFNRFENFKNVIDYLTGGKIQGELASATEENIIAFIEKYETVTPREIQDSFDLTSEEVNKKIKELEEKSYVSITPKGNGYFISMITETLFCDPNTGLCYT